MYQVLHIMGGADVGGMSAVVLNYYKHIDRKKIHFDIALTGVQPGRDGKKLEELGSNIYYIPMKSDGLKEYKKAFRKLLETKKYDAVHVHENETSYVALGIAKKAGVKKRIAHSHTSAPTYNFKQEIRRLSGCILNYFYATDLVACGRLAGERVFGKWHMKCEKVCILPNAIETERFFYDENTRETMRQGLGVKNNYVILMVGRLAKEKNHEFALKMIRALHSRIRESVLFIAGEGEERDKIESIIRQYDMESYVKLLGSRNDINEIYQAVDACILPSVHEGFPVVAVEALASGLPLLLSDTITDELRFSSLVKYLPIDNTEQWVKELITVRYSNDGERLIRGKEIMENGYNICQAAEKLEKIYLG